MKIESTVMPIHRVRIFGNDYEQSGEVCKKLKNEIQQVTNYALVVTEDNTADLVISVGGDGGFLKVCREESYRSNCIFSGIDTGTIGFLQDVKVTEIPELIRTIVKSGSQPIHIKKIPLLEVEFQYENGSKKPLYAVNEFTIYGDDMQNIEFHQKVNGQPFHDVVCTRIVISTPIGSTALNKSAGGPILFVDNVITSVLSDAIINRENQKFEAQPLVMKNTEIVFPDLQEQRRKNPKFNRLRGDVTFSFDGKKCKELDMNELKSIKVCIGNRYVNVLNLKDCKREFVVRTKILGIEP